MKSALIFLGIFFIAIGAAKAIYALAVRHSSKEKNDNGET